VDSFPEDASMRPADCASMDDIRAQIDRLDRRIVPLLAERLGFVGRAAAFKETRAEVVVPWRVEEVVAKATALAEAAGADTAAVEAIYRALVAASIAHEEREWDRLHAAR
jgi:isochorismate pyruvate lyase